MNFTERLQMEHRAEIQRYKNALVILDAENKRLKKALSAASAPNCQGNETAPERPLVRIRPRGRE